MKLNQKRMQDSRQNLGRFIVGWALIWLTALFLPSSVTRVLTGNYDFLSQAHWVAFYTVLSTLQFFWVRRRLRVDLRHWILLAVFGAIAGTVAWHFFEAIVQRPFPPKLWSNSPNRMPEPEHVMQLKYALYVTVTNFFLWSTPLIIQWLALRKRFAGHGLWLIAAVVHAPLTFFITEHGGILIHVLKLFDKFTEISLIRDAQPLGNILFVLDWATPTAVMGLALYALLAMSVKTGDLRSPVKSEDARLTAAHS